jgi:hypothetical protein
MNCLLFVLALALLSPLTSFAQGASNGRAGVASAAEQIAASGAIDGFAFQADPDRNRIKLLSKKSAADNRTCLIDERVTRAALTHDGQSLMINESALVLVSSLQNCGTQRIKPLKIPKRSGMLVDFHAESMTYISHLLVTTQPFSYLAIVAKLDGTRSIVSLPGAFVEGQSKSQRLRQAFVYEEDGGPSAKISRDGRYATVSGVVDCSEDAFPGVWNLQTKSRVVLKEPAAPGNLKCKALFE